MKHILSYLTLLSLVAVLFVQTVKPVRALESAPSGNSPLQVIESSSQDLVLDLTVPDTQLEPAVSDRGPCQALRIPGWGQSGESGQPALPVKGTLVGLPPGANPRISVLEAGPVVVQDGIDLCPAATLVQPQDPSDVFSDLGEKLVVDPAAYASNRNFPEGMTFLGSSSLIRSQRVSQVLFQPFQYNPVTRQLTTTRHLRIRVDFGTVTDLPSLSSAVDEGPFESVLSSQVINYAAARAWRAQPSPQLDSMPPFLAGGPAAKISVTQDGMVRVPYAQLSSAGVPVGSLDPNTLQLYNQGSEVAILVQNEAGGTYSILFYGQKINTRFTDTNVYWLTWGKATGLRMASASGAPAGGSTPSSFVATVHAEEDHLYMSNDPSGTAHDHWYWTVVNPPGAGIRTFNIPLTQVNTSAGSAHVRGLFKGYAASPQHHTHLSINGHLISQDFWPARSVFSFDVVIPQSYLLEGNNIIQVEGPLTDGITINQILVNWFEVDYNKNYTADGAQTRFSGDISGDWQYRLPGFSTNDVLSWDITDPLHPAILTSTALQPQGSSFDLVFQQTITTKRQYLAAAPGNLLAPASISLATDANLHGASNGADYIIITHPNFSSAIQPLADFYTARGLRVKVVNVLDIYDEFSGGVFDPQAIHDFLAYTYASWARPAPSYVLLVGDGNYDFKNFRLLNDPVFIPPYLAEVDPWLGETAADNRYVTVSGNDILPDMALGRLPVQTPAEASTAVAKILNHYQNSAGDWAKKAIFVAGINDPAAGDFAAISDAVINTYLVPQSVPVDKVYYGITYTSEAPARQAIADAINAGRGLVHFTGHSNPYSWSGNPNDFSIVFDQPAVLALNNAETYPIVIGMTCYTGYYIIPGYVVLDETLIRTDGKGAVATWSPTGKGVASGHDVLDSGFFQAIYQNHVTTLGSATNLAKYYLYANANGLHRELIDTYILFGDPAMLYQNTPTAANMKSFNAQKVSNGVQLAWETTSEVTTAGFNLSRSDLSGKFVKLNANLIQAKMGGQSQGSSYTFQDTSAVPGIVYQYKLDVIETSLQVSWSSILTYRFYSLVLPLISR